MYASNVVEFHPRDAFRQLVEVRCGMYQEKSWKRIFDLKDHEELQGNITKSLNVGRGNLFVPLNPIL